MYTVTHLKINLLNNHSPWASITLKYWWQKVCVCVYIQYICSQLLPVCILNPNPAVSSLVIWVALSEPFPVHWDRWGLNLFIWALAALGSFQFSPPWCQKNTSRTRSSWETNGHGWKTRQNCKCDKQMWSWRSRVTSCSATSSV